MPIRSVNPTSPARRYMTFVVNDDITKSTPEKSLLSPKRRSNGRNVYGRITVRHRGGGHKRMLRDIDFRREKLGIPATVKAIEYDPNRSARIALLFYRDGEKRYIIAPLGLKPGDVIMSGPQADILPGNALPIRNIPLGTLVHNVELQPGKGGQLCRSAGTLAQVLAKEGDHANIKLPSGEVRQVKLDCMATIGQVGNLDHENVSIGKAGRVRWKGFRPTVRGTVMNPVDHPMGGGEGKGKGNHPMTPWGKPTKGYKTRRGARPSDRYIVTRRTKYEPPGHGTLAEEGPVHRGAAGAPRRGAEPRSPEEGAQDLVAAVHDPARVRRSYACRPQRKEVHPRVRHREHGGASSRGVRPHPLVPGAWLLRKGIHVADGKVVRRL